MRRIFSFWYPLAATWLMMSLEGPFLAAVIASPFLARHRLDHLGSRAREALADLNAHAVDTIQGLTEVIAFEQVAERRQEFEQRIERHISVRLPFFRDLTLQNVFLEVATGLGGLVVVMTGAAMVADGRLEPALLPMLTLLAMAAFLNIKPTLSAFNRSS